VDSYQGLGGSLAEHLRELGFRAAVGAPIVLHGRLWGAVLVSSHDAPFPPDAEQRVGDFAELAAHALAHAQAREDLAASRARIVEAADAERRRLERNLHDGAQQRLVSLALTLRVAALKLPEESEARALVERAGEDLAEALAELREFARGVHPAVLTERGLAAALESLAARAPLPVQLEVRIAGRLPEQVEAALYYVAAEGLTNAARYARARSVSIAVTGSDDHAEIEVGDDGIGGASQESGSGLRGLCDRVEAFGGRLRLHSPPGGGTALSARIPLRVSSPRSPSDPASAPA
jgi:signal transduction histidine kinase